MAAKKAKGKGGTEATGEPADDRPFDERMEELERIATGLESGDLGLEEALQKYKQGVALLGACRKELEGVRTQVMELAAQDGQPDQPFAGDPDGSQGA